MRSHVYSKQRNHQSQNATPPLPTTSSGDLIKRISNAFATAKIPYAVGGAHALNMWANPRATVDIGVNVFLTIPQFESLIPILKQLGATTVEDAKDKSGEDVQYYDDTFVLEHFLPDESSFSTIYIDGIKVELFPNTLALQQQIAIDGVREVPFKGTPGVLFLSAEAVIAVKLLFFRRKDQADILNLLTVKRDIDWDYLDMLVSILNENAIRTYSDGYSGVDMVDWWPDVAAM